MILCKVWPAAFGRLRPVVSANAEQVERPHLLGSGRSDFNCGKISSSFRFTPVSGQWADKMAGAATDPKRTSVDAVTFFSVGKQFLEFYSMMIRNALFVAVLAAVISIGVRANESTSPEDVSEILWSYEEDYIQAHLDADHPKVLAFWDESFIGWPSRLDSATGKDGGVSYLQEFFSEPQESEFRIEREGIRVNGDIAILHYRIHAGSIASRVTHTWIRRESGWFMLGGMDSPEAARGS